MLLSLAENTPTTTPRLSPPTQAINKDRTLIPELYDI